MLEAVRQNLKGTLVVVVIVIFIVPMVIGGVGTTFLGSAAGTDALSVNGETVSEFDLDRMVRSRRARILAQGNIDASSPLLEDENLRQSVVDGMTQRLALVTAAKQAGMAISDSEYQSVVIDQEQFKSDGVFDQQKFRYTLSQAGFTPAKYRQDLAGDLMIQQQTQGFSQSSFITDFEFEQLIKATHQKRSFFSVSIPAVSPEEIDVSEAELQAYYDDNQAQFEVPEKARIEYLELTLDWLASSTEVSEQDIRDQYEMEVANFSADASYEIAHIFFEDASNEEKIQAAQAKLEQGAAFADVAKEYSEDVGSADTGGELGVLTAGMFPETFEQAVYELEQGEVSSLVVTDDGAHIIKALSKTVVDVPTFEARKGAIQSDLARALAQEEFAGMVDQLGEYTFSAEDLVLASEELGLKIQQSDLFDSRSGVGIARENQVRSVAFSDEIKATGNNSNVIELSPERAIVLRVSELKPAYVQDMASVKDLLAARVRASKAAELAKTNALELQKSIEDGGAAKELAAAEGYKFEEYSLVKRSDISVPREVLGIAFRVEASEIGNKEADIAFVNQPAADGSYWLVGVESVEEGATSDLRPEEKDALLAQLSNNMSELELGAYTRYLTDNADVELH